MNHRFKDEIMPTMRCIYYKAGYKYQLTNDYAVPVPEIRHNGAVFTACGVVGIDETGLLQIKSGYAWDGPSGPTIDTPSFMRGSLVHDALYQLIREGVIESDVNRYAADRILQRICKEDGMPFWRRVYCFYVLRLFGGRAVSPSGEREELSAP